MKGRSQVTYQNKIRRIESWHNYIVVHRQELDGLKRTKKPLKEIDFFIDKLKKPNKNK
jgi:hypothetical protein